MAAVYWGTSTNLLKNNGEFTDNASKTISTEPGGWLGFLDALGKVEGKGSYATQNGSGFMGIYQFGTWILKDPQFTNTVGAMFNGTTAGSFRNNPIEQELAALMEFSGAGPSQGGWFSRFAYTQNAASAKQIPDLWPAPAGTSTPIRFNAADFKQLLNQYVEIRWTNDGANVGRPQVIQLTTAGISAAAHLVGQLGVAYGMSLIYQQLYNPDGTPKYTAGQVPTVTLDVSSHLSDASGKPIAWLADGSGVAFSTYIQLFSQFDISPLIDASNTPANFNELATLLIQFRKTDILNYLSTQRQDVAMSVIGMSTNGPVNYANTIQAVLSGLGFPTDQVNQVNNVGTTGKVVLAGGNYSDASSANGDLIFALGAGLQAVEGSAGNDILVAGKGNDTLEGGKGNDKYVISSGDGKDTINDTDGQGSIYVNGYQVEGTRTTTTQPFTWTVDPSVGGYQYKYTPGNWGPTSPGMLTITGGPLGQDDSVVIKNFDLSKAQTDPNGYLGIHFAEQVALVAGTNRANNPFLSGNFNSPSGSTTLHGGGQQTFTAYVSAISNSPQTVCIALTGADTSAFSALVGSTCVPITADGSLNLTIPAGSDSVSFSLLNTGNAPTETLKLTATYGDPVTSTMTVNYVADNPSAFTNPVTTGAVDFHTVGAPDSYYNEYANVGYAPVNLYSAARNENTLIDASGTSNNVILASTYHQDDVIIGGAGSDYIGPSYWWRGSDGGNNVIAGGGGQDVIVASVYSGVTEFTYLGYWQANGWPGFHGVATPEPMFNGFEEPSNNRIYANSEVDIPTAISQANAGEATGQQGDFIQQLNGNNTIVGGNGNDFIEVGTGNNVIVAGSGNTTIVGGVVGDPTRAEALVLDPLFGPLATSQDPLTPQDIAGMSNRSGAIWNYYTYSGWDRVGPAGWWSTQNVSPASNPYSVQINHGNGSYVAGDLFGYNPTAGFLVLSNGGSPFTPAYEGNTDDFGQPLGRGNNTIFGGSGNDLIVGSNGNNYIEAGTGNTTIYAGSGNNTIFGGSGHDLIIGQGGDNYISGGSGDSTIVGGAGNSTIFGGTGNDTIYAGDGLGQARATFAVQDFQTISTNDNFYSSYPGLNWSGGAVPFTSGAAPTPQERTWASSGAGTSHYVFGGTGNDVIYGSGGNDTLIAGGGNTTIYGGDGNEFISGGSGNNLLKGGTGNNTIVSGGGNDTIYAGDGNATIYGGSGANTIYGGAGSDVIYAGDSLTQVIAGTGTDTIYGGAGTAILDGRAAKTNLLVGGTGNQTLYGGAGDDTLVAGAGNDILDGGGGNNTYVINPGSGNAEILSGGGTTTLQFNPGIEQNNVTLSAAFGSDGSPALVIQYGSGAVTVDGGLNTGAVNQVVFIDPSTFTLGEMMNQLETVPVDIEGPSGRLVFSTGGGASIVGGSVNNSFFAWGGNDTLVAGSGNDDLHGEDANDLLIGGTGNDTLEGSGANDTLVGGTGINTFVVNDSSVVIVDQPNNGNDSVFSSVSYVLPENLQNLTLTGSDDLVATGNDLAHVITANQGNDTLIAGSGLATLVGGPGNDTFVINNPADVIVEQPNAGNNTVVATFSYALSDTLQNLTLVGSADLTGTGNDLDNVITGNGGNDTLIGGGGDDTLIAGSGLATLVGGPGNDTFVINNAADVVLVQANAGTNTLVSSVSVTLRDNIQNLTLVGNADLTGTGNDLANVITANGGNDTLIAGSGVATLVGGAGNDTFVINNAADVVLEQPNAGNNTILSSVSYALPENVQNITLTGSADLTATGNDLDNVITANNGNDTLIAGVGNDTLVAGAGDDLLVGGETDTTFVVGLGDGHTTIDAVPGQNTLVFGPGIGVADVVAHQAVDGTSLVLTYGDSGAITIAKGLNGAVSKFRFDDGTFLGLTDFLDATLTDSIALTGDMSGVPQALYVGGGNDTLIAGNGNDTLYAGAGVDYLYGGSGSSLLQGGPGTAVLTAGTGDDTLAAGAGIDTLVGGPGNNTFVINNAADVVLTQPDSGNDTLVSSVSVTLLDNIRNLTLIGDADLVGIGNDLNNVIVANSGNDTLIAGSGLATLVGGPGNDTFVVNNAADVVVGDPDDNDTVQASVSYSLAANAPNVRNLLLTGDADIAGTGNALDNVITANNGDDLLSGGAGNDTLYGGTGLDVFTFGSGGGADTVVDTSAQGGVVLLQAGLRVSDFTAVRLGDDLLLQVVGSTTDSMLISGYYANPQTAWAIRDDAGNTVAPQAVLDATAANPTSTRIAQAESDFIARVEAQITGGLLASGYSLQPDGSWSSATWYSYNLSYGVSAYYSASGLDVQHTVTYLDGTSSIYASQENWVPTGYQDAMSDSSVTIERASVFSSSPVIDATSTISNDAHDIRWVQVQWGQYYYWPVNATQTVPVTDGQGQVIGSDQQVITPLGSEYLVVGTIQGSLPSAILSNPGNLSTTGEFPQTAPLDFVHHNTTDVIQQIYVGDGDHTVHGGQWTVVNAGSGNNVINGAGFVYTGSGNDTVLGAQIVYAGTGNNEIDGAATAYGGSGNDTMIGGGTLVAGSGNDLLIGGSTMVAGSGNDRMFAGTGDATFRIDPTSVGSALIGGASDPTAVLSALYSYLGIDDWQTRYESAGTTVYFLTMEEAGYGYYDAQGLMDQFQGWGVTLQDVLDNGWATATTVEPLPALAIVSGSTIQPSAYYATADIPVVNFSANDYQAVALGYELGVLPLHNVVFGQGVSPGDLRLSWGQTVGSISGLPSDPQLSYTTLDIAWGTNDQSIRVMIPHSNDPFGSGVSGFTFADGTTLSMAQIIALAPPAPGFDPELLFQFQLGMGTQTIASDSANVVQFAQGIAASDVTVSHDGTDLVIASKDGTDSLRITGWYANPSAPPKLFAQFADGTMWTSVALSGLGLIQDGSAGGETLTGLAGFSNTFIAGPNDTLVGASGNDTYVFNVDAGTVHISDPGGNSTIRFGAGITPDMISLGVGSLLLRVGDNGDAIHIEGFDPSDALNSASIQNFQFDDGSTLTYDQLVARGFDIYGGSGDETLTGTNLDNRIHAGTGNDVLIASGVHDTLYGGAGNDTLIAGSGVDLLVGGSGNDTLIAGTGGDMLVGGTGQNTFVVNAGDGQVTIDDSANEGVGTAASDVIQWRGGIASGNLTFTRQGSDVLVDDGSGDTVLLKDFAVAPAGGTAQLMRFAFDDGGSLSYANDGQGTATTSFHDASGALTGSTTVSDDRMGDVTTRNYDSNGALVNDTWRRADGSYGSDTFNTDGSSSGTTHNSDGSYTNYENDGQGNTATQNYDSNGNLVSYRVPTDYGDGTHYTWIYSAAGAPISDTWRSADGSHGSDTYNADGSRAGIRYNPDGTYSTYATDVHGDTTMLGGAGNDNLWVFSGNDSLDGGGGNDYLGDTSTGDGTLIGGSGNDTLQGGSGNDILDGGTGDDWLLGGTGADSYLFRAGDGRDTILDGDGNGGSDTVRFDASVAPADIRVVSDGASLYLQNQGAGDRLMLSDYVGQSLNSYSVIFADGTQWSAQDLQARTEFDAAPTVGTPLAGSTIGTNSIFSYTVPDQAFIDSDAGDTLTYGAAMRNSDGSTSALPSWLSFDATSRTFSGTPGQAGVGIFDIQVTATDSLGLSAQSDFELDVFSGELHIGTDGNDTLIGGSGGDSLDGGGGDDSLGGGDASDTLIGGAGDDVLEGGSGDDYVEGDDENDILLGGAGNDDVEDWSGNNYFDAGSGEDYVYADGGANFVIGGTGNDWIDNYGSNNVIAFNSGDGNDTVYSASGFTLSLGGGIQAADLSLTRVSADYRAGADDLVLSIGSGDSIRLSRWAEQDPQAWPTMALQIISGGTISTYDLTAVINDFLTQAAQDPNLSMSLAEELQSHLLSTSATEATGGALAYQYAVNGNTDSVSTTDKQAILADSQFGAMPRSIDGINQILIGTAGDDSLVAGAGNDTLIGGTGNDTLYAGTGRSTFVFNPGDGRDSIVESANNSAGQVGSDVIEFGPGISSADVHLEQQGADVLVRYGAAGDSVLVKNFDLSGMAGPVPIGCFQFADGSTLAYSNDGQGGYTLTAYDAQGIVLAKQTGRADGSSSGSNLVTGETWGTVVQPGAGYSYTYDNASLGNGVTESKITYAYADGSTYSTDTLKEADGSYQQAWSKSDGSHGSANYVASTGETYGEVAQAGAGYSYAYDNTNLGGGVTESEVTYTYSDGSMYFTDTVKDPDGSYRQSWSRSDGSHGDTNYVASTGETYGDVAQAGAGYSYTYDNANLGNGVTESKITYTYADDSTYSTDTVKEPDGSYQQSWTKSDGSHGDTNYVAATGETSGDVTQAGAGYSYTYDNTNLGNGVTESKLTYTYDDGSTYSTDTVKEPDGSYQQSWMKSDGSHGSTNYVASTGETYGEVAQAGAGYSYTYDNTNLGNGVTESKLTYTYANGSTYSTDTVKEPDGSYQQSWMKSDGSHGDTNYVASTGETYGDVAQAGAGYSYAYDNTKLAGGVTESKVTYTYANGSTYSTDTIKNPDGSYLQSWTKSDGTAGSVSVAGGVQVARSWLNADGSQGVAAGGNRMLIGGSSNDSLSAGTGNELLLGGQGNDAIVTGAGADIVAFNMGDGQDSVRAGTGQNDVLSLGGNFAYSDLAFQKSGNDLVLDMGASDSMTFKDWYASAANQEIVTLQVIAQTMSDFAPGSSDVLRNANVETFDFRQVVSAFDQARAADPMLSTWSLTDALLNAHLFSSDSAALGGDLAYEYGMNSNLTGFSVAAAESTVSDSQFGTAPQGLHPWNTVNTGAPQLK